MLFSIFYEKMKDTNIDGKFHHQVNTSFIYVSNHNFTHFQSLFDQVSNGLVFGQDVTVINTSPHFHVKKLGIGNNDISSVPIATVGSL